MPFSESRLHAQARASLVLPADIAFALLELFTQFAQLVGIIEDLGDALILAGRRVTAGLRFL